ncbi:MAG: hypothetical protein AB7O46_08665 [Xanthobacteraceae bacterium]
MANRTRPGKPRREGLRWLVHDVEKMAERIERETGRPCGIEEACGRLVEGQHSERVNVPRRLAALGFKTGVGVKCTMGNWRKPKQDNLKAAQSLRALYYREKKRKPE